MVLVIIGGILVAIGFILSLTILGAFIGIPLIILGSILIVVGMFTRRKTVITNVVSVQNAASPPAPPNSMPVPTIERADRPEALPDLPPSVKSAENR